MVVGATGGIAGGKSTVVRMLQQLGASSVDFDLIARQVVEPGKPAFNEIVAFFGERILQKDGELDRKKLGAIVFHDESKRKVLEAITHPRIVAAFLDQVRRITKEIPNAIILADIPLLLEAGLRHLVHKVILVYIPREIQIERLMKRDGISLEAAQNILKAQWPIDEKLSHADFVIHNEGTPEETRRQVEELWKELKKCQKAESGRRE
ncbi:MAG: dephospho-CoA kinase [Deltaproteobacteria bacterium]|nr:dephospho-CoA kinase [Deltaproteobacteria bacterium]